MKTIIIALATATLLSVVVCFTGSPFQPAELISILFAASLFAWTVGQYRHRPVVLTDSRPIFLPLKRTGPDWSSTQGKRLAA